jgi:hypothetical protein
MDARRNMPEGDPTAATPSATKFHDVDISRASAGDFCRPLRPSLAPLLYAAEKRVPLSAS